MNPTDPAPIPSMTPNFLSQPRSTPHYHWLVVGMLWFICFFNYADRQAIFSIFPVLEKQYHFTKSELGAIGAAFTWVYAFAAPIAGHVGDRYPRKWVILAGLTTWSLITGLTAQCTKVWQFMLVRGSEGLGETFYMPASMALISDYHAPATRSRAIGLHQTSIYAGTIGGGALAGWMAQKYGWQSPFWILACAGIGLGLIVRAFIREPRRNQAEEAEQQTRAALIREEKLREGKLREGKPIAERRAEETAKETPAEPAPAELSGWKLESTAQEIEPLSVFLLEFLRTKTAVLLVLAFFGANMVGMIFLTWMPTFLNEKFKLNLALAGVGATVFTQTASMGGAVLGGSVADMWSKVRREGRILVQAVAVLLGTPFVFLCGYTRNPWLLIGALTLFGLSKGAYDSNLTAAFYDVITPSRRSTATGLMNLVGFIGGGLGALTIGIAVDHGVTMSTAISSTAVVYLAVAAILFYTAVCPASNDILARKQWQ